MPDRLPCEFFLIRYVPDPVKGEFTNIGVVLREASPGSTARVQFTRDWARVRCMDPDADLALLEALETELDARLRHTSAAPGKPILELLEDSLSNSLQISEPRACLAENLSTELELLLRMYVEPLKVKQPRVRTGRAALAGSIRTHFERAGVWPLLRKRIAASTYTDPGDPMRIDCGYKPATGVPGQLAGWGGSGVIRMFHAVSLEGDLEAAKVLAFTAPRLREGVARIESASLDLAAVVEPIRQLAGDVYKEDASAAEQEQNEQVSRYRYGVRTMEAQGIRVLTVNDLARAAETARIELRV